MDMLKDGKVSKNSFKLSHFKAKCIEVHGFSFIYFLLIHYSGTKKKENPAVRLSHSFSGFYSECSVLLHVKATL